MLHSPAKLLLWVIDSHLKQAKCSICTEKKKKKSISIIFIYTSKYVPCSLSVRSSDSGLGRSIYDLLPLSEWKWKTEGWLGSCLILIDQPLPSCVLPKLTQLNSWWGSSFSLHGCLGNLVLKFNSVWQAVCHVTLQCLHLHNCTALMLSSQEWKANYSESFKVKSLLYYHLLPLTLSFQTSAT